MHPHLHTKDNKNCAEIMAVLDECHAKGFLHKVLGNCNDAKNQLNRCLRAERLERTRLNREKAREKREVVQKLWREIDEENA